MRSAAGAQGNVHLRAPPMTEGSNNYCGERQLLPAYRQTSPERCCPALFDGDADLGQALEFFFEIGYLVSQPRRVLEA